MISYNLEFYSISDKNTYCIKMEMSIIQWLTFSTLCVNVILGASAITSPGWLTKSLKGANRKIKNQNTATRHSIETADSNLIADKPSNSCCYNDGICIMNTFCHCKKNFYGRYCEHRVRHRSCGTIKHGTWMAAGCHLCHCFDGKITCKTTTIRGCDKLSYIEGHEENPDYMVGMDKQVEDYELFYEEDYNYENIENAGSRSTQQTSFTLSMIGIIVITQSMWNFVS